VTPDGFPLGYEALPGTPLRQNSLARRAARQCCKRSRRSMARPTAS